MYSDVATVVTASTKIQTRRLASSTHFARRTRYRGKLGLVLFGRDAFDTLAPLDGAYELILSSGDPFLIKITRCLLATY